jgi:hypothetical protein
METDYVFQMGKVLFSWIFEPGFIGLIFQNWLVFF